MSYRIQLQHNGGLIETWDWRIVNQANQAVAHSPPGFNLHTRNSALHQAQQCLGRIEAGDQQGLFANDWHDVDNTTGEPISND